MGLLSTDESFVVSHLNRFSQYISCFLPPPPPTLSRSFSLSLFSFFPVPLNRLFAFHEAQGHADCLQLIIFHDTAPSRLTFRCNIVLGDYERHSDEASNVKPLFPIRICRSSFLSIFPFDVEECLFITYVETVFYTNGTWLIKDEFLMHVFVSSWISISHVIFVNFFKLKKFLTDIISLQNFICCGFHPTLRWCTRYKCSVEIIKYLHSLINTISMLE